MGNIGVTRMTLFALAVGLIPTMLWGQASAAGSLTAVMADKGSCGQCKLELVQVATVGRPNDAELIPANPSLFAASRAAFFVVGMRGGPIMRYDSTGRYLGTFGRTGDGPGEYRQVWGVIGYGPDSVLIFGPGRITILALTTGKGRSNQAWVSEGLDVILRGNGGLVAHSFKPGSPMFAPISKTGKVEARFGPMTPTTKGPNGTRVDYLAGFREYARSSIGGFWTMPRNLVHRLERWGDDDKLAQEITRVPPWFTPAEATTLLDNLIIQGPARVPSLASISGLAVTDSGLILVSASLADAKWRRDPNAGEPPKGEPGEALFRVPTGGWDGYLDTMIEIFDERTGEYLGSWRLDRARGWMTETGLMYFERTDEEGLISFDIYRIVLHGR